AVSLRRGEPPRSGDPRTGGCARPRRTRSADQPAPGPRRLVKGGRRSRPAAGVLFEQSGALLGAAGLQAGLVGGGGLVEAAVVLLADAELVVDVLDARQMLDRFFRQALLAAAANGAFQGHLAVFDADIDAARVDVAVLGQGLANVFLDPVVGPLIAL